MTLARRILWDAGAPARLVLLGAIHLYQLHALGVARRAVPLLPHLLPVRGRGGPDPRRDERGRSSRLDVCCAAIRSGEVASTRCPSDGDSYDTTIQRGPDSMAPSVAAA